MRVAKVRAKTGYEILQGFKRLKNLYGNMKIPLLVLHGAAHPVWAPRKNKIPKKVANQLGFFFSFLAFKRK